MAARAGAGADHSLDLFDAIASSNDAETVPVDRDDVAPPGWRAEGNDRWRCDHYSIVACESRITAPARIYWTYWHKESGLKIAMNGGRSLAEAAAICAQHRREIGA